MQQENKNIATNTYVEMFRQNIYTKFRKNQKYTTPGLPQINYFCGKSEKYINQLNPGVKNRSAFTLVELIIVITILAILATIAYISFQGYTKDARDGIRMSDIKQIYNGLSIYKTQTEKTLLPDNYINIQSGTTTISYQGYAGTSVLRTLKISGGKDPGTKDYYIYTTDVNTKKAQLMTYMETADKEIQYLSQFKSLKLIQQAEATNSGYYQDKKIYVYGDKIGILTNNKVPLQETTSNTGIDITTLTGNITTYFGGNVYSGGLSTSTGTTLINQINGAISNTIPCSATSYSGYTITSLQDKQNQTFTKTGVITGGTQTGSIVVTCNNGTLSYSSENTQTSCGANFTLNGNACNAVPVLLLHGDNVSTPTNFLDGSPSNKAITRNGDARQVVGGIYNGGGYFDGSSSYLSLLDNTDFNLSNSDFTIDFWVNPKGNGEILSKRANATISWLSINIQGGIGYLYADSGVGGNWDIAIAKTFGSISLNTWTHIALTRQGSNWYMFKNGMLVNSFTSSLSIANSTQQLTIGLDRTGFGGYFNGNLDEIRISKGIARWTTNFTPQTSEYATDIYTKLLLHFNGNLNSFVDDSGTSKAVTANGSATQYPSKFGSGTMYFDGSSSYLSLNNNPDWSFGSGDFTVDMQVNFSSISSFLSSFVSQGYCASSSVGGATIGWAFDLYNGNLLRLYRYDGSIEYIKSVSWVPSLNVWYHVSVVKKGNILRFFVNGTQIGIDQDVTGIDYSTVGTNNLQIGLMRGGSTCAAYGYFNGYIDELRIVKGAALRTSNFTPPTSPY